MSVVVDTSIIIDVLRGHVPAVDYLFGLDEVPAASEIVRVEIVRGLRSHERVPAERLLQEILWVVVDEPISRRAGQLGRRWNRSHPGISTPDLVIAATAQELDARLATTDVRHFPMFRRLRPPYVA